MDDELQKKGRPIKDFTVVKMGEATMQSLFQVHRRKRCRGHIIQAAVWTIVIIVHPPVIYNIFQFIYM